MKLYFSPGACALASQITLREAGLNFDLVKVDLKAKTYAGGNYYDINPKGYVPALEMNDGATLTEGSVILQWIADQVPAKNLIPKLGTSERLRANEWLNYIATELHKGFSPLFYPANLSEAGLAATHAKIQMRLGLLDRALGKSEFILGSQFSVVDAYAYNILRWTRVVKVELENHANIQAFMDRMAARESVQQAIEAEGIRH